MEIEVHVKMLRRFFTTLFRPEDRLHIVPGWSDDKIEYYNEHVSELPIILHKRRLVYGYVNANMEFVATKARRYLKPFCPRASTISAQTISKLRDFNELGYDIFFAVNPLVCSYRCQKTVRLARHIVLESDSATLDEQLAALECHRENFSAMIHSGNKSRHAYAIIDPPLWNPSRVHADQAWGLGDNTRADWDEYKQLALGWIDTMAQHGIKIDPKVAKDYSRISRVPGFKHSKSGCECTIEWLNRRAIDSRSASYWKSDIAPIIGVAEVPEIETSKELGKPSQTTETIEQDIVNIAPDAGNDCRVKLETTSLLRLPYWYSGKSYSFPRVHVCGTGGDPGSCVPCVSLDIVGMTDVKLWSTFLDDLPLYWKLKKTGIPRRHQRIRLHDAMFTAARYYGWSEERLESEWRTIVSIHPHNIRYSVEKAVKDIRQHYRAIKRFPIYLPNTATIPEPNFGHELHLESQLEAMGCPNIANTKRVIIRVLLPLIRRFPVQCQNGTLGIKAKDMLMATVNGKYRPILTWLIEQAIMTMTKKGYYAGRRTRTYKVNILLVLLMLGYSSKELDWTTATRWDVAILGEVA